MRGIPEIMFCSILMFMWSFGALPKHVKRQRCDDAVAPPLVRSQGEAAPVPSPQRLRCLEFKRGHSTTKTITVVGVYTCIYIYTHMNMHMHIYIYM